MIKGFKNETYFIITAKLILYGFKFNREISGNVEVWNNPITGKEFKIKRESKDISPHSLKFILNQAGISIEEYINI